MKTKSIKKLIRFTTIALVFFVFGYLFGTTNIDVPSVMSVTEVRDEPVMEKRLHTLITLETKDGILPIAVFEESIHFLPFDVTTIYKELSITKDEYPKMFKQGIANDSIISAELMIDDNDKTFVKVTNSQPDHGAISPVYSLIVDPISGEIKEYLDKSY